MSRRKVYAALVPLLLLLVLWVWFFAGEGAFKGGPNGKSFEADFAMFVGAGRVLQQGGNPYDNRLLFRSERAALARQGLPIAKNHAIVRVGNPPLFFWLLEPLTSMGFGPIGLLWGAGLYLLSAAGFLILLRQQRWRSRAVPLAIFLLMPQIVLGAFYGNVVAIVFFAMCGTLALEKRFPFAAGCLLCAAWMKPPVALPIVLLIFLFHVSHRRRLAAGFAVASGAGLVATLATTGTHSLALWIGGMLKYSHDITQSPDISSLAGLYVRTASSDIRPGLQALSLLTACVLTWVVWRRFKGQPEVPVLAVGWLWLLWFLATPYAHFFDEILLTLPVIAFLGRNGQLVTRRDQIATLYVLFFSLFFIEWAPSGIQLLCLPLLMVTLALEKASRTLRAVPDVAFEAA